MVQPRYGIAFRELRMANAVSQLMLVDNDADRQALSRFERGRHAITVDRLSNMLDRIPATYQEYLRVMVPEPNASFEDFMGLRERILYGTAGRVRLRMLADRYRARFDETHEEWLEHRAIILAASPSAHRTSEEGQRLRGFLRAHGAWSHYEFALFTYGLTTVLNLDDVEPMWSGLIQPFDVQTRLGYQSQRRQIGALLMVAQLSFADGRLPLMKKALDAVRTIPALAGGPYEELRLQGLRALYMIHSPEMSTAAGRERLRAVIELCDFVQAKAVAKRLRVELAASLAEPE